MSTSMRYSSGRSRAATRLLGIEGVAVVEVEEDSGGRRLARLVTEGVSVDYLFLDASFFRMHPGSPAEPVLAAWGISTDGKPAHPKPGCRSGELRVGESVTREVSGSS